MDKVEFTHEGEPLSKSNHYQICSPKGKKPFMYVPVDIKKYGAGLAETAKAAMGDRKPFSGPVSMTVVGFFNSRRRKDIQNTLKSVCDALNDIVYEDDSQIVTLSASKFYNKEHPGIRIIVQEIEPKSEYPLTSCK